MCNANGALVAIYNIPMDLTIATCAPKMAKHAPRRAVTSATVTNATITSTYLIFYVTSTSSSTSSAASIVLPYAYYIITTTSSKQAVSWTSTNTNNAVQKATKY
jgi:hypothetical protein